MKTQGARRYTYELLHSPEIETRAEHILRGVLAGLIVINVVSVILETVRDLENNYRWIFLAIEYISVAVFTAEYGLRLWSCVEIPGYQHPVWGRLRYMFSMYAVIDALAILPFYLPHLVPMDLRFLRGLRLIRLLRVLKLGEYSHSLALFAQVFQKKRSDLIVAFGVVFLVLVLSSSLMYYLEYDAQPEAFSSIPASIWWGIATLTTIGYGDIFPVTLAGRTCAAFISLLGIGLVALPSGILVTGFVEELQTKKMKHVCPKCGEQIELK